MYNNGHELLQIAKEKELSLSAVVIEAECKLSNKSKEEVIGEMQDVLKVMLEAAEYGLKNDVKSVGGLIGGDAKKVARSTKTLCGTMINKVMARALSCAEVNASMGRIVAAPTAGSCGILPATIITAAEILDVDEDGMINALFTAAGIGQIIAKKGTLAGAEGGCQVECGAASAMAAAAIVEMAGGPPETSLNAGAIAIKNIMGLVCDPIAGLVESPCAKRNASGAVNAMISADLALANVKSVVPFDEVIDAMFKVGRALPVELRETAMGGLATTPTGIKIKNQIYREENQ